jgi:hypothetical protein
MTLLQTHTHRQNKNWLEGVAVGLDVGPTLTDNTRTDQKGLRWGWKWDPHSQTKRKRELHMIRKGCSGDGCGTHTDKTRTDLKKSCGEAGCVWGSVVWLVNCTYHSYSFCLTLSYSRVQYCLYSGFTGPVSWCLWAFADMDTLGPLPFSPSGTSLYSADSSLNSLPYSLYPNGPDCVHIEQERPGTASHKRSLLRRQPRLSKHTLRPQLPPCNILFFSTRDLSSLNLSKAFSIWSPPHSALSVEQNYSVLVL